MNSTNSVAELLSRDDILQVVFVKTAKSTNSLWALNRIERNGELVGWELLDLKVQRDHQFALMSTDKATRVAAKHLAGLYPQGFTREDFRR